MSFAYKCIQSTRDVLKHILKTFRSLTFGQRFFQRFSNFFDVLDMLKCYLEKLHCWECKALRTISSIARNFWEGK